MLVLQHLLLHALARFQAVQLDALTRGQTLSAAESLLELEIEGVLELLLVHAMARDAVGGGGTKCEQHEA